MKAQLPRIGIIGAGTIARALLDDIHRSGLAEVDYILVSPTRKERDRGTHNDLYLFDPEEALGRNVDLVVEAAVPEVLARLAPVIVKTSNLCGFSCTALADATTLQAVQEAASASGFRCYVPHGAILGLDGLADGRDLIERVAITTTKSGRSLGIDPEASGVVFEGSAGEACRRFPRNVNVHAATALAGIGFDRTWSRIVAVPDQVSMEHRLEVSGRGLAWDIRVSSQSLGGVTGSYTPSSAIGSVRRILGGGGMAIA